MKNLMIVSALTFSIQSWAADAPKSTPEMIAKGKTAYVTNCLTCHGEKGDGMGPAGKYMAPKPRNLISDKFKKGVTAAEVFASVTKGLDGTAMASFASIPEADRWAIVYYIQTFRAKK